MMAECLELDKSPAFQRLHAACTVRSRAGLHICLHCIGGLTAFHVHCTKGCMAAGGGAFRRVHDHGMECCRKGAPQCALCMHDVLHILCSLAIWQRVLGLSHCTLAVHSCEHAAGVWQEEADSVAQLVGPCNMLDVEHGVCLALLCCTC